MGAQSTLESQEEKQELTAPGAHQVTTIIMESQKHLSWKGP